jgi:hypothetical protein
VQVTISAPTTCVEQSRDRHGLVVHLITLLLKTNIYKSIISNINKIKGFTIKFVFVVYLFNIINVTNFLYAK